MKHRFSIALQLYSVRESLLSDFEGVLRKISEMGYDGVEFSGLYGHFSPEVKSLCRKYGLCPVSAHVPFIDLISNPNPLFTYSEIGCRYIVIPYLHEVYRPGSSLFHTVIDAARLLGRAASDQGMHLCYHNQSYDFLKLADEYALDYMFRSVPSSLMSPELDTFWIHEAGVDPASYIRRYSDREMLIHLKDYIKKENPRVPTGIITDQPASPEALYDSCPLGMGEMDVPSVLKSARESAVHWLIVEQDSPCFGLDELQSAERSIHYLRSLIA